MEKRISLYFHFPFCKKKCNYCDFCSSTTNDIEIYKYIDTLKFELDFHKEIINNSSVETIYCGGGTPSLLSVKQWEYFSRKILSKLSYTNSCEFTIECNPESYSEDKAHAWLDSGVNRLSIGIQSFNDNELKLMGRIHNSEKVFTTLNSKALSEFKSVNGDLIFGTPNQTLESVTNNLKTLFSFDIIKHFSSYELTISSDTQFFNKKNRYNFPSENLIEDMTNIISELAKQNNFLQYEISNFAKPDFECKHNSNCWNYTNYIGLGTAAHSFIYPFRFANTSNTQKYINLLNSNNSPEVFREKIFGEALIFELLFLGLRTKQGIDISLFEKLTNSKFYTNHRESIINSLIQNNQLIKTNHFLKPTQKGILFADALVQKLI